MKPIIQIHKRKLKVVRNKKNKHWIQFEPTPLNKEERDKFLQFLKKEGRNTVKETVMEDSRPSRKGRRPKCYSPPQGVKWTILNGKKTGQKKYQVDYIQWNYRTVPGRLFVHWTPRRRPGTDEDSKSSDSDDSESDVDQYSEFNSSDDSDIEYDSSSSSESDDSERGEVQQANGIDQEGDLNNGNRYDQEMERGNNQFDSPRRGETPEAQDRQVIRSRKDTDTPETVQRAADEVFEEPMDLGNGWGQRGREHHGELDEVLIGGGPLQSLGARRNHADHSAAGIDNSKQAACIRRERAAVQAQFAEFSREEIIMMYLEKKDELEMLEKTSTAEKEELKKKLHQWDQAASVWSNTLSAALNGHEKSASGDKRD